jgi:hypothetical protein
MELHKRIYFPLIVGVVARAVFCVLVLFAVTLKFAEWGMTGSVAVFAGLGSMWVSWFILRWICRT